MAEQDQLAARRCAKISDSDPRFRDKFLFQIPREEWVPAFFEAEQGTHRRADRLSELLDQYGWPGPDLVGEEGAVAAWLLLQHADSATQRRCLPVLTEAVEAGRADPEHLACVTDRIELQEGRPQIYGTHLCVSADGGREPVQGVVDSARLDQRRAALGLLPWNEYVAAVS